MASHWIWINSLVEPSKVELLLDSSFLMFIVSTPAEKIETLQQSFGKIELVVLNSVIDELKSLCNRASPKRAKAAKFALSFALESKIIVYNKGNTVDDKILNYASSHGAIVATLDSELRHRLKNKGVTVVLYRGNLLTIDKP